MKTARLELLKNLFEVLNTSDTGSTNYILSLYFINNYDRLEQLNIYDVSDDINMSRATVRRFCQTLGYDNFLELKKTSSVFHDGFKIYVDHYSNEHFVSESRTILNATLDHIEDNFVSGNYDDIVYNVMNGKYVYILSSSQIHPTIQRIQNRFLSFNIKVIIPHDLNSLLKVITEGDLIIVISITGQYYETIKENLLKCNYLLLTNSEKYNDGEKSFKLTEYSKKDETTNDYPTILYSYGIEYFFDILLNKVAKSKDVGNN